jgi:4-amino-4-deoxy-L-arabinose transferase-like glycosyltransferase
MLLLALLVVALAAALRFWGIDQGLPFPNARPDEREALEHTIGFPAGDLNPRWFVYPNLFFWIVWVWAEMLLVLRRMVVDTPPYATMLTTDLSTLLLYGRLLSALVGTATVALVWTIGRRIGGWRTAGVAALLVAVDLLHVRDSHALKADVFLAAGVLASLWLLASWTDRPSWRRGVRAGLAIGLTTACKYPGILLLGSVYHAAVLGSDRRGRRRLMPGAASVGVGIIALGTFLAASPYLVLDFPRARDTATFSMVAVYGARPQPNAPPDAGLVAKARRYLERGTFGYHAAVSLRHGCGLLFALLTVPAIVSGLWRRHRFLALAAGFTLLYYLVVGISPVHQSRYVTPLVPLLALLIADCIFRVGSHVRPVAFRYGVVAAVVLALVVESALPTVRYDRIIARTDTRVLATRWMTKHLPQGAVVAQLGSLVFPIADPVLPAGVVKAAAPVGAIDLDRYGVTHVVVHEHPLPFSAPIPAQLRAIQPRLRLLAEFTPFVDGPTGAYEPEDAYYVPLYDFDGVERPGPIVRIYAYGAP